MCRTYTLSSEGFINPSYMRNRSHRVITVSNPRTLELDGMTLRLLQGEPDLPVGSEVKVWLDRWFHCETLRSIKEREVEAERKADALRDHEAYVKRRAHEAYFVATESLIAENPAAERLKAHFETLCAELKINYQTYRGYWGSRDATDKQKSDDAYSVLSVLSDAVKLLSNHAFAKLEQQGLKGVVAYAYSPREGARNGCFSPGKNHFQLLVPVNEGRYKRMPGDTLCRLLDKQTFWGLENLPDYDTVTCQRCLTLMLNRVKVSV